MIGTLRCFCGTRGNAAQSEIRWFRMESASKTIAGRGVVTYSVGVVEHSSLGQKVNQIKVEIQILKDFDVPALDALHSLSIGTIFFLESYTSDSYYTDRKMCSFSIKNRFFWGHFDRLFWCPILL